MEVVDLQRWLWWLVFVLYAPSTAGTILYTPYIWFITSHKLSTANSTCVVVVGGCMYGCGGYVVVGGWLWWLLRWFMLQPALSSTPTLVVGGCTGGCGGLHW
jgi:hypothetical protein